MITCDTIERRDIRVHYELATLFYRLLWGVHIHHGLWNADESPRQAQRQLIEHLASTASIPRRARVLDVGCGMGGSSVYLARHLGCDVTGITLSRIQRRWASCLASLYGVGEQTKFHRQNAEAAEFPDGSYDVMWSIECTEHLFDKAAFFRRASHWLSSGGRVAICAWLASDEPHSDRTLVQVADVCKAFLCPSLGTANDYTCWLEQAGLEVQGVADLTPKVTRTWEICQQRVRRSGIGLLARLFGRQATRFVENFDTILNAYRSGAMKYASIVARRPA